MMDRLQKKCVIGSLLLHGLLVLAMLVSAAFSSSKDNSADTPVIRLVDPNALVTDGASHNPGPVTPNKTTPPAPQPPAPADPEPVKPTPPVPVKAVTPPPTAVKTPPPTPDKDEEIKDPPFNISEAATHFFKTPPKNKPKVTTPKPPEDLLKNRVDVSSLRKEREAEIRKAQKAQADADAKADREAAAENATRRANLAKAFNGTGAGLSKSVASSGAKSTSVEISGDGDGQAAVNYRDSVYTAYYAAWIIPEDVSEGSVRVSITVSRSGSIISSRITKRSNSPSFNSSVERALRSVKSLPAFPAGSKDSQRSFPIEFKPNSKQSLG